MMRSYLFVGFIAIAATTVISSPHGAQQPSHVMRIPDVLIGGEQPEQVEPVYVHFAQPSLAGKRKLKLWATHYSIARAPAVSQTKGVPLLDMNGNMLGPFLQEEDFCKAAMEGTVAVSFKKRGRKLFDFDGVAKEEQVDCTTWFPRHAAIGKSRFKPARAVHGSGAGGRNMVPFRTIAVDPHLIPLGSVLYVPAARGTVVTLENGDTHIHDGYFYAGDVGGAIDGDHVDVFLGYAASNPFLFVKSHAGAKFEAYLVEEPLVLETFASAHAPPMRAEVFTRR